MLANTIRALLPLAALLLTVSLVLALSHGPEPGVTGAPALGAYPAEPTCAQRACHPPNLEDDGNGGIEILAPAEYSPGEEMEITVRLASTSTQTSGGRRWGFELTALQTETGAGAGTFQVGGDLRIVAGAGSFLGRTYVTHTEASFRQGAPSPVEWTVTWTAPDPGEGTVEFHAAGNAANGNGNETLDHIYHTSATVTERGTPAAAVTWGGIKRGWALRR